MSDQETNQEDVRNAAQEAIGKIEEFEKSPEQDQPSLTKPQKQEKEKLELVECPRCGHQLKDRTPVKPSEEETRQYFRCLMTGKIFKKNYSLFNGELTAQYCLLTGDESDVLSKALKQIKAEDFVTQASLAVRIKLLFYLRRWGDIEFQPPETSALDELWQVWQERFGDKGEDMPVLMIKVMMEFNRLTEMLPMAGLDENFYKGVGLS